MIGRVTVPETDPARRLTGWKALPGAREISTLQAVLTRHLQGQHYNQIKERCASRQMAQPGPTKTVPEHLFRLGRPI